ncbi:DUF4369 domain-containing protein [Bacteroides sp. 214]|uniref:DUF4369 domain-containing protein n=1 Tax=Bacteroides sp. 214 TaxID=2302935 RepID=UPI0013D63851|nr:DUF4369 domain-containing protein [Bacteroides sp. 214]NDW13039.1 DUF4369 domain-containing protein [Bacteroides sp. 214]
MKKLSFLTFVIVLLASCQPEAKFTIEGTISAAAGKKIYLEASAIQGIALLDSVKLKENGTFKFNYPAPASPEFFRLRIENKVINFAVDSTETIKINAPFANFSTAYSVEGSESSTHIKELVLKQIALQSEVNKLLKANQEYRMTNVALGDSISNLLSAYKNDVKFNYIFTQPYSPAAYFALFQKLNEYLIFDPMNNKEDLKCFQAVATSWDMRYPHALRVKNLANLAIRGLKNTRIVKEEVVEIPEEKISEVGIIDIALPDIKGNIKKVSELKGKVVLIDFTVYQTNLSTPHNHMLVDLYKKYADKGLEIYQLSLDSDEHFWRTVAGNLPWVCVRDGNGIYSTYVNIYNVQKVPTYFLVNKNSELSSREDSIESLESAIKALL